MSDMGARAPVHVGRLLAGVFLAEAARLLPLARAEQDPVAFAKRTADLQNAVENAHHAAVRAIEGEAAERVA